MYKPVNTSPTESSPLSRPRVFTLGKRHGARTSVSVRICRFLAPSHATMELQAPEAAKQKRPSEDGLSEAGCGGWI